MIRVGQRMLHGGRAGAFVRRVSMRSFSLLLIAGLVAAQPALAVTDAERIEVYREFRRLFDARQYREALPVAQELVRLTEEQYGPNDRALATPLTNLGTTYYRLGDYAAAEQHYLRSLEILEATASSTDRAFLRPLHGLGATYFAAGQYQEASIALKRAIDLSRNLDGLFNVEQLEIIDPLIASYVALDQLADAEREHQYAFRVAESAYGRDDVRMLEPLDRYARWFEFVGRYTTARGLHARALMIAERVGGRGSPLGVDALRGIARTYRLEFLNGTEEEVAGPPIASAADAYLGPSVLDGSGPGRLNQDGERALKLALEALRGSEPLDYRKIGETLVELGDWYLSSGSTSKAIETYREAWQALDKSDSTELLESPRLLAYRPPASSLARTRLSPEDAEERFVEVQFTVTRDGRTANIVETASDAPDQLKRSVITAVRKARYSPRFENGEPVDTPNVVFRERLAVRKDS
jgi:Periplasmic protein TonB, links inner and outer membranes